MADGGFDIPQAIVTTANQYGVDPGLALSVGHAESNLDPTATSPKGAVGVMQLMPDTAAGLGVDPHDVHQNIIGGVKYLKQLSDKYGGDHRLVAAAYNAGPGAVDKHGGVPPFPETQAYVDKVAGPDTSAMPSADDIEAQINGAPANSGEQVIGKGKGITVTVGGGDAPGAGGMPSADDIEKQLGIGSDAAPGPGAPPALSADPESQIAGFMSKVNRGLGIGDEIVAGANAFGSLSHDFLTGQRHLDTNDLYGSLKSAESQQFDASLGRQRGLEAGYQAEHPNLSALGQGTGMALPLLIPGGGEANALSGVATGSRLGNIARGATTAALTGAAYGAADAGTPQERLEEANRSAFNPVTLALGAGAGALARTAARAPGAPANTNAATLEQAGVPLTVGQAGNALAHRFEDAAESLPLTGAAIRARKTEGLQGFNRAAVNEALAPIQQTVDGHGRDAIAQANQHVSNAYNDALHGVTVAPDAQFHADLDAIRNDARLPQSVRDDIGNAVNEFVTNPLAADGSGQSWKRVDSDLNTLRRSASNAVGSSPQALSLQRALDRVQEAHWGLLERQNPQAADAISNADAANAAMERVRGAAATTATAARDGLFTASDLNRAVASKGGRAGKRAYGQGTALMQGLTDAGQAVLPSTVPDSGTALRSIMLKLGGAGGALAGIGATAGHEAAVGSALGSVGADMAGSLFYSRPVQNALRGARLAQMAGRPAGILAPEYMSRLSAAGGVAGAQAAGPSPAPNALSGVSPAR